MEYRPLASFLFDRKILLKMVLSAAATSMFVLSLVLPWWSIDSNLGMASAPLWSSQPLESWAASNNAVRLNWFLMLPVLTAAMISLLLVETSWRESTILYATVGIVAPLELISAERLLSAYFTTYLGSASNASLQNQAGNAFFTANPAGGLILYVCAYLVLTALLAVKLFARDAGSPNYLKNISILVVFSGFFWYMIGSIAFPADPSWVLIMSLDTAFIDATGVLLYVANRHGLLHIKNTWKERVLYFPFRFWSSLMH